MRWVLGLLGLFRKAPKKWLPGSEFQKSGPLSFIFYDNDPNENIRYEYAGLVGALSTIYPEKLGSEFATSLPEWKKHWDNPNTQV